jgi:hypothetical protein
LRSKKDIGWISAFIAFANKTAFSTTALLGTGRTPGKPLQIGQMLVLGSSSQESALQPQKIFETVLS